MSTDIKHSHSRIFRRPKNLADLDRLSAIGDQMSDSMYEVTGFIGSMLCGEYDRQRIPDPKSFGEAIEQALGMHDLEKLKSALVGFALCPICLDNARAALRDTLSILDDLEREMLRGPT